MHAGYSMANTQDNLGEQGLGPAGEQEDPFQDLRVFHRDMVREGQAEELGLVVRSGRVGSCTCTCPANPKSPHSMDGWCDLWDSKVGTSD